MKKTDVLIIGGSAAGMVTALTGKSNWVEKDFLLVKKNKDMMVPCGIPYIFGTLDTIDQNLMPVDALLKKTESIHWWMRLWILIPVPKWSPLRAGIRCSTKN
jgi:NADH oxidase (H2O2-forming)